jgi:hypothetical protein
VSRQLTAPPGSRATILERLTAFAWQRLHPTPQYPIVRRIVTGTADDVYNLCRRNPDVHRHNRPVQLADGQWRVTVMITDREHPTPGTLARARHRTWVAIRPTVKVGGITLAVIAALYTAGFLIWYVWGAAITAAVQAILVGVGAVIAVAALITVGSWWTSHGRNGCPGLHCTGCGGSH